MPSVNVPWRRCLRLLCFAVAAMLLVPAGARAANCAHCNAVLAPDAAFCSQCGARVEAAAPATVYCWHCGQEQPGSAKFCSRCGAALETRATPPASRPEAPAARDSAGAALDRAPASATGAAAVGRGPGRKRDPGPWAAPDEVPGRPPAFRLRPREIVLPPQVFEAPTGDILPSLMLHVSGGLAFGFSDDRQSESGVLRFGLGDVAEAQVSTSNIVHIVDVRSNALLGFRLRVPTKTHTVSGKERLRAALAIAASDDHHANLSRFTAADGATVNSLDYTYRETTGGLALTWTQDRMRYHGALYATDLRATNVAYVTTGSAAIGRNQRDVHVNFAGAIDYAANARTWFLAEVTSSPRVEFEGRSGELNVESRIQYGTGVRFFPDPLLAIDTSLHVDNEAVGLGDVQIGFGLHLMVNPRSIDSAKPAGAPAR